VADQHQFASFFVNDLFFGIEVEMVQEVTTEARMTPVPLAPAVVRGLINLRGQIVPAIDLRRCLQLPESSSNEPPVNLILYTGDSCTSLLVDAAGEVLEVDQDTFEPPPVTLRGRPRELIRGAYKLPDKLMHILDLNEVLRNRRNS
jgi:purine-binding chemotaxis protein CheW